MIYFSIIFAIASYFIFRKLDDLAIGIRNTANRLGTLNSIHTDYLSVVKKHQVPHLEMVNEELMRSKERVGLMSTMSNEDKVQRIMEEEARLQEERLQNLTLEIMRVYHFDMPVEEARTRAEGILTQIDNSMMPQMEGPFLREPEKAPEDSESPVQ